MRYMRIFDGRTSFVQWDVNVKITDDSFNVGDEVHFYNGTTEKALVLLTYSYEGMVVVDVPNIFLTTTLPIKVYRYYEGNDCARTMETCIFEVEKRAKPEDYVYTETEYITVQDYIDKAFQEVDGKYAHLVDGKVPAENIPTAAFDIIRGYFNSGGTDFHAEGEHNEEVGADGYYVVPRQGVFYFDMSAPNAEAPFAGAVCIWWRGNGFERIATVGEFEAALQSMKQSIDLKIEGVEQNVDALNGQIGDISAALDKSNAYDIIVTSEEQFLSERANFRGKRVLFKDVKFTLQEMDFNYAEYIEFCNVAVGSTSFVVSIRNFKFGNFTGFTRGWSDSGVTYNCDDLNVENFAFVENLIPPIDSVHGSGDNILYSNGLGIMNCAMSGATNCCNIVNCHLIGRHTLYFTNCTSISNLHAKSLVNDVVFENCTHLSNIALLESDSTFAITYTNCSDVDPDTCDGYEGSGSGLPTVSTSDNGKILQVVDGSWQPVYTDIPDASELNKGQFLMSNGSSYTTEEVRQLPIISETSDSGKVLIVDDATRKAAWVTPPWAEKSYVDGLVGDISTALDELHAYAQNLVNGGSAV